MNNELVQLDQISNWLQLERPGFCSRRHGMWNVSYPLDIQNSLGKTSPPNTAESEELCVYSHLRKDGVFLVYISRLQVLGQNSLTLNMRAVTSFETSVAIASDNNITSYKTLIFSVGVITVTEDQDVKKGNFVKLHVRQFAMSEYKFPFFPHCYCSYYTTFSLIL